MKKTLTLVMVGALTLAGSEASAKDKDKHKEKKCKDPISAVLETLNCIETEDLACALAGYDASFVKLHNGVDTETVIDPAFWGGAFALTNISLDYDHIEKVDKNQVSLRYVETVDLVPSELGLPFPFPIPDQTFIQHEHALVTVNGACQMTLWDQYGDNKEQDDVTDAVEAVLDFLRSIGVL